MKNESFPSLFLQSLIDGVRISPEQFLSLDNKSLLLHLRNIFLQAVIFPKTQIQDTLTTPPPIT